MAQIVGYVRVSTTEQGDSRNGIEAQVASIEAFCAREGHELLSIHEEVVSGKFGLDFRPVLCKALDEAKKAKATLLVSKLDRLTRDMELLGHMTKRYNFGTVEDGLEAENVILNIKGTFAQFERERISLRTKEALAGMKARGEKIGGGFQSEEHKRKAIENSRATVKADADTFAKTLAANLKRMRRDGMSVHAIADELNKSRNPTPRGGKWYGKTVLNILNRLETMESNDG